MSDIIQFYKISFQRQSIVTINYLSFIFCQTNLFTKYLYRKASMESDDPFGRLVKKLTEKKTELLNKEDERVQQTDK